MGELIENQFKYQSTYPDENKGAATAGALGGTTPEPQIGLDLTILNPNFISSVDENQKDNSQNEKKNQESIKKTNTEALSRRDALSEKITAAAKAAQERIESNKQIAELKEAISNGTEKEYLEKLFSNILGSSSSNISLSTVPTDLLKKLNIENLVKGLDLNTKAGGKKISSVLKNSLDNLIKDQLSALKSDTNDTFSFLTKISGKFKEALKSKVSGVLLSRIYIPEVIFLAGLTKFKPIGANINYSNKYIRNLCFTHDFPLVLQFVNSETGFSYNIENGVGLSEGIKAAKLGSWHVAEYIMEELNKEINELKAIFPLPAMYDRNTDLEKITKFDNTIKELQQSLLYASPRMIPEIEKQIEEIENNKKKLFIYQEDEYKKSPDYKQINTLIKTGEKQLHSICKEIIVNSYSNLTVYEISRIISKFNIRPRAFGSKDTEFGKSCLITNNDINIIAPFITPKENLSSKLKNTKVKELIKNKVDIKYINPRNNNCKKIYVYLQSLGLHGKTAMYNLPYKERLEYLVYSSFVSNIDSAVNSLLNTGISNKIIDVLNTTESAYYDYAKSVEKYLYDPSKTVYINYNDFTKIPELNESDYDSTEDTNSKLRNDQKTSIKTSPAGGNITVSIVDPSVLDVTTQKTENGIMISKPLGIQSIGNDSLGNSIFGYPSDSEIEKAIKENKISYRDSNNPNGSPIDPDGNICPIIGYDQEGKAVYGRPVFYPDSDPIATDVDGNPVFGYSNGVPIIGYDSKNKPIYGFSNPKYEYQKWIGTHSDEEIESLNEEVLRNILKYNYEFDDYFLKNSSKKIMVDKLKTCYKYENTFYGYDIKGNRIVSIDIDGRTIIGYDKYSFPKYGSNILYPNGKDEDGNTIFGFTEDGKPVYGFTNKKPIIRIYPNGSVDISDKEFLIPIGKTKEGYPIYYYDSLARPIIGFDANGKPILEYNKITSNKVDTMNINEITNILIASFGISSEDLNSYTEEQKKNLLKSKIGNNGLQLPITEKDSSGNVTYATPLIKEINVIEEVIIIRQESKRKNASNFGYIPTTIKDDFDLKDPKQMMELENLVSNEIKQENSNGFVLRLTLWKK